MSNKIVKQQADLGVSAYLLMNKFSLLGKKEKTFYFEIEKQNETKFDELIVNYLFSEFHYFDHCLMGLKKLQDFNLNHSNSSKNYVSDLGVAAYLLMHKFKLTSKLGKNYYFDITSQEEENQFNELNLQYTNSEFHDFDSKIMSLKKIGSFFKNNNI
jgi:hypothetical protein